MATRDPAAALTTPKQDAALAHLRDLLKRSEANLRAALPAAIPVQYMTRVVLTAVIRQPELLECHPLSVLGAVFQAAQLGLVPDGFLGQAYLVPFTNHAKQRKEAQFIPGYRGLLTLARRSGELSTIDAEVVHAADDFQYARGTSPTVHHVPSDAADPGPLTHVWALARLRDGGLQLKVMNGRDVDAIKRRSAAVRAKRESPWDTDPDWMWKKTCLKQLCKLLPVSVDTLRAMDLDDTADVGIPQDLSMLVDDADPPTPRTDPASAPDALTVTVCDKKSGARGPYWVIRLSDGRTLSTRAESVVAQIADLLARRIPIRLLTAAAAATDSGIDGTAVLVYTPAPTPSDVPRLDAVIA